MSNETRRGAKQPDKNQPELEFTRIKEGLKAYQAKLAENLRQRVGTGDWKISEMDCPIDAGKDKIDIVFSAPDGKKEKFIIVDISIPHLGIGQKYGLPGKAKIFQKEREVSALRIKKAIILIRKGTESVSTQPGRIRCPIIEIQLEHIVKPEPVEQPGKDSRNERFQRNEKQQSAPQNEQTRQSGTGGQQSKQPAKSDTGASTGITGVSQDLLFALKEAIVHECLSTMHKRCNKYVRKGLWRWIEREIMDPNVHFFLIILSSIYQGKTGEILSRRFKNSEDYSSKPDEVIQAIFSRENNLADEIKKDSERHRRALTKFLVCFSQTPPFEYLKSVFLKDFRSFNDGLRARMNVYSTLEQLLERCGFEGEKETKYPLEILDELKIFQGIMTGNYAALRTDNASKKLKHLVPQVEWSNDDIYSLRNQLAKALNLPAQEFNLNAFLPQAFFQDAKIMAESRKEAIRAPIQPSLQTQTQAANRSEPQANRDAVQENQAPRDEDSAAAPIPAVDSRPPRRDRKAEFFERRKAEKLARQQNRQQLPRPEAVEEAEPAIVPAPSSEESGRPINVRNLIENISSATGSNEGQLPRETRHYADCDESQHRYFENFGGHLEEDSDAVRLALAIVRHEQEKAEQTAARTEQKRIQEEFSDEETDSYRPPLKHSTVRQQVNMNQNPPRKPSRQLNNDGQPGQANRPDRKRRFSRNNPNRNKVRRPSNNGGNR